MGWRLPICHHMQFEWLSNIRPSMYISGGGVKVAGHDHIGDRPGYILLRAKINIGSWTRPFATRGIDEEIVDC